MQYAAIKAGLTKFVNTTFGSAFFSALSTALVATALAKCSTDIGQYGWALFIGLPIFTGFVAAFLHSLQEPRSTASCYGVTALALILIGALSIALQIDGAICILMALPLALLFGVFGASLGQGTANWVRKKRNPSLPLLTLFLAMPALMGAEAKLNLKPPLSKVVTSVDIKATPDKVWEHVIAFSPIPAPNELIFKAGIAYPLNATIEGRGVGAIRYCNFSTGPFIEPITVWQEPTLLRFDVTHNPHPMKEWSFYKDLEPNHFHNFMVSKQGQFKLIKLNGDTTRLEGTTWYYHRLWPTGYWRVISDNIIHQIHYRVLNHIKVEVEKTK
jgi:hypothetical protein